ncbi:MAG: SMC-Scp complex subunit ScpB [Candidatus Magasanikbacteria bacterium]|nr:SMC-Scp complex subunit ScpB [Candidatus Magasanikbacteria bacterium]
MNNSQNKNLLGAIEAILFVYGEPIEIAKIAKITKTEEAEVKQAIQTLDESYQEDGRGIHLIVRGEAVELVTKPQFSTFLQSFIKEEFRENLTPASLETLSLIIYLGPLTRSEIDYYRGVNSSFILRNLLVRGLVNRIPHPEKTNTYLYEASFDLLKYLGISQVEELPEYERYRGFLNNLKNLNEDAKIADATLQ